MRGARGGPAEGAQDGCPAAAPPGIAPSILGFALLCLAGRVRGDNGLVAPGGIAAFKQPVT